MILKFRGWAVAAALLLLQACSVNTETTFYKDAASSMESNVMIDRNMLSMMNMMGNQPQKTDLSRLSSDWKSLYDLQKDGMVTLNKDSAKVLQKLFLKINKDKDEIYGLSIKYDKLLPGEIAALLTQSRELKQLPLQNVGTWNGKTLTINTDLLNSANFLSQLENTAETEISAKPKTKSDSLEVYGRQMAQSAMGMMKMFPVNITNTIRFQRPIKSITGSHEFIKQIDRKTIQITVRSSDMIDNGKRKSSSENQKIVITTE